MLSHRSPEHAPGSGGPTEAVGEPRQSRAGAGSDRGAGRFRTLIPHGWARSVGKQLGSFSSRQTYT